MRKYRGRPTGSEPMGLGPASVRLPHRIPDNVGDNNRFSAVHGGPAGPGLRSDAKAGDGVGGRVGMAVGVPVLRVLSVRLEEKGRAKKVGKLAFPNSHQVLQYLFQTSLARYHL